MPTSNELIRGSIEIIVLKLLMEGDMYGYQMIKQVNERSNGFFEWREGSLYPCLHKLEGKGLVDSYTRECGGMLRRYYSLTKTGRKLAAERTEASREFCKALTLLLQTN